MKPWRLLGKNAEAFKKQIEEKCPNVLAQNALKRGRELISHLSKTEGVEPTLCVGFIVNPKSVG